MKRVVAIVCALAVVAAGVTGFVLRAAPAVGQVASAPTAPPAPEFDALSAELDAPEMVSPASNAAASAAASDSAAPERAALAPRVVTEIEGPLVRVVSRQTRAPFAHAIVYWIETDDRAATAALLALGPEHAEGPWPRGTRVFRADDSGRVRLPRSHRAVRIVGFAPRYSGTHELMADWRSDVTLRLEETICARVVTPSGKPAANVSVQLVDFRARVLSDAEGRVRFVLGKRDDHEPLFAEYLLRAEPSNLDRVELRIPALGTFDERWTLELPPTGSLDVHLVDAEAVLGDVRGNLTVSVIDGKVRSRELSVQAPFLDEHARVRGLRAGVEHEIAVRCEHLVFGPSFRVRGPSFDGEEIVHELRLADAPLIALRVLDSRGEVWSGSYVHVQVTGESEVERGGAATTRAGRLYVFLAAQPVAGAPRSLTIWSSDTEPVELDISSARPRGVTSFGDVQLGPLHAPSADAKPFSGRKLGGAKR